MVGFSREEPAKQDAENYEPQKKNKKKKRKRKDNNIELDDPKVSAPSDNGHSVSEEPLSKPQSKKRKKKRAAGEGGVSGDPQAVADSVQSHSPDTESGQGSKKRRRRSAAVGGPVTDNAATGHTSEKRHKVAASAGVAGENGGATGGGEETAESTRTGGKKRRGARPQAGTAGALLLSLSDARLEAFGLNPKKVRAKVRYGKKHT